MNRTQLKVKVVPGATKSEIVGMLGDALKVRLRSPADKDKANRELIECVAKAFNVSKQSVSIVSGHRSAYKYLSIESADEDSVRKAMLERPC